MAENNSDPRNRVIDLSLNAAYIPNMWGRPKRPLKGDVNRDGVVNNIDASLVDGYLKGSPVNIDRRQADVDNSGNINYDDYLKIRESSGSKYLELYVTDYYPQQDSVIAFKKSEYNNLRSTLPITDDTVNNMYVISVDAGKRGSIKATPVFYSTLISGISYTKALPSVTQTFIDDELIIIPDETEVLHNLSVGIIRKIVLPKSLKAINISFNSGEIHADLTLSNLDTIYGSFSALNFYGKTKLLDINSMSGCFGGMTKFYNTLDIKDCALISSTCFLSAQFYNDVTVSDVDKITNAAFTGALSKTHFYKDFNLKNINTIDAGAISSITVDGNLNIINVRDNIAQGNFGGSDFYGNVYIEDASILGTFLDDKAKSITCIAKKQCVIGNSGFNNLTKLTDTATETYLYPDIYVEGYTFTSGAFNLSYCRNVHIKNCKSSASDNPAFTSAFRVQDILIEDCGYIEAFPRNSNVNVNTSKDIILRNNTSGVKLFFGSGSYITNSIKNIIVDNTRLLYESFYDSIKLTEPDSRIHIKNNSTIICPITLTSYGIKNPTVIVDNSAITSNINSGSNGINLTLNDISGSASSTLILSGSSDTSIKNNVTIINCTRSNGTLATFSNNCRLTTLYLNGNTDTVTKQSGSYSSANINTLTIGKNQISPIVSSTSYEFGVQKILFEPGWNDNKLKQNFFRNVAFLSWIVGGDNDGIVVLPESIETIESYALGTKLHSFVFGPNVKSIGGHDRMSVPSGVDSVFVFKGVTPPTFAYSGGEFQDVVNVYVPDDSIAAYQTAMSAVTSTKIVGMSTMPASLIARINENTPQ